MKQKKMKRYNRIGIVIIVAIILCSCRYGLCPALAIASAEIDSVSDKVVEVTELDMGEYSDSMTVGEKQLLSVTVLPLDVTDVEISYRSSNSSVATVNGLGRITAVSVGSTEISAICGKVSASFILTVTEAASTKVTDLDLGDYSKEMTKGETQVLSITPLPLNAAEEPIAYVSSNTKVATVNSMGRVTALRVGKTTITVSCDGIAKSIVIKVKKKTSDKIPVKKIEIAEYEEDLEVDKTLTLSATVLPSDATESKVTYHSSNPSIATVNSSGEVKGIDKGNVIIYAKAGNVKKKIPIHVIIATQAITLNNDYLVLKPNEIYQLQAEVSPKGAQQKVTYQSGDISIATVSNSGLVTAKKAGSTSIIVSNGDYAVSVSVIVNQALKESADKDGEKKQMKTAKIYDKIVDASKVSTIDSKSLEELYRNEEILKIIGDGYVIEIDGKKIVNFKNEFYTDISLIHKEQGSCFTLNQGNPLCGAVTIYIDAQKGKYLYLKNVAADKYQLIQENDLSELILTTAGEYQITDKKIHTKMEYIKYILIVGALLSIAGGVAYVVVKKKYWFW